MLRTMMTSKVHRATVTQADLHHVGSITVTRTTASWAPGRTLPRPSGRHS